MNYHEFELRPMQPGEAEAMYALLEHSFGEPAAFFKERELAIPQQGPAGHWVATLEAEVVAHAVYYPGEIQAGERMLGMGILANVCTHARFRGRGLAARLVECANAAMTEAGLALSCLVGRSDYYSRFGYTNNAPESRCYFEGDAGPADSVHSGTANDAAWMGAIYQRNAAGRAGSLLRSPAYWQASLAISYIEPLAREAQDGYAALSYYRPPGWALEELQLLELEADNADAAIALFRAALKRASSYGANLLWSAGPHPYQDELRQATEDFLQDCQSTPGFMWKKLEEEPGVPEALYLSHFDIR